MFRDVEGPTMAHPIEANCDCCHQYDDALEYTARAKRREYIASTFARRHQTRLTLQQTLRLARRTQKELLFAERLAFEATPENDPIQGDFTVASASLAECIENLENALRALVL
jgi:hypothetical protein